MNESVTILAIETSAMKQSAAVLTDGQLRSNIIASQIEIHTINGGWFPRSHQESSDDCFGSCGRVIEPRGRQLCRVECDRRDIRTGLVGALLIGVSYAKALAFATGIP
jgi:N6-L-threonylcarbamoyladenine synthase